jgi:hypothetical protein
MSTFVATPAGWYPDPEHRGRQSGKSRVDARLVGGLAAAAVLLIAVVSVAVVFTVKTVRTGEPVAGYTPADTREASATAGQARAAGAGQAVSDGNFSFKITGVERVDSVTDPQFPGLLKVATGEFIIVRLDVTNIGHAPQTFFASFTTLSDGAATYRSDDEAWIYLGNTLADLNPGETVATAVVFDVPDGTQPESVELHDGPHSDGVVVGL